jgi:hypothetical protein
MSDQKPIINEHIRVFIRQRPALNSEAKVASETGIQSFDSEGTCSYYSGVSKKGHDFKFEGCLGANVLQQDVYNRVAQPIVDSALKGYSG